jgi:hypothetical protein
MDSKQHNPPWTTTRVSTGRRPFVRDAVGALAKPGGRPTPCRLDQKRDNRFSGKPSGECSGTVTLKVHRSGGCFDPMGPRGVDYNRCDDMQAVVRQVAGTWALVTLTVDRAPWLTPQAAYERLNERVRKVASAVSRLWFNTFEVQAKTGDGWPHWHLLVWVPPGTSPHEVRAIVRRHWVWRELSEEVDHNTGEILKRHRSAPRSAGFSDVQVAQHGIAVAKYISKYITKSWPALPEWILDSTRRWRKFRASQGVYEVLERLYRHEPKRGSRRPPTGRIRSTRSVIQRITDSGSRMLTLTTRRSIDDRRQFLGCLNLLPSQVWRRLNHLGIPIELDCITSGRVPQITIPASAIPMLVEYQARPEVMEERRRDLEYRTEMSYVEWRRLQDEPDLSHAHADSPHQQAHPSEGLLPSGLVAMRRREPPQAAGVEQPVQFPSDG